VYSINNIQGCGIMNTNTSSTVKRTHSNKNTKTQTLFQTVTLKSETPKSIYNIKRKSETPKSISNTRENHKIINNPVWKKSEH
jgi:oxalate decarboxylase/phosphoglucose isomerase-like protein (cupin superfamily)